MKSMFKFLILSALIAGIAANFKDIRRYVRIRNM
jgi:hypothetical protein